MLRYTTREGKPSTNEQRIVIAKVVQQQLVKFFYPPNLRKNDMWLAFIKAFDMFSYDASGYGGLGESGSGACVWMTSLRRLCTLMGRKHRLLGQTSRCGLL